jgi:hypothetical protein
MQPGGSSTCTNPVLNLFGRSDDDTHCAGMTVARSALSPSSPAPAPRAAKAALGLDRSAVPSDSGDLSDNVR